MVLYRFMLIKIRVKNVVETVTTTMIIMKSLADPGGAHPARAPPNGRGPMIFLCPKGQFFSFFFLARFARD